MDVGKEFLGSSTIHGLSHILSAKTTAVRYCWLLAVCLAFSGALVLIGNSYLEWKSSPILSTISTHPVSELEFPSVTICPPKGSTSALNYDLRKVQGQKLSVEQREELRNSAWMSLIQQPAESNSVEMNCMAKPRDLQRMYKGYQSVPTVYGTNGFEMALWDSQGSIESAACKRDFGNKEDTQKRNKTNHYVLNIPPDVFETSGGSTLTIDLEVTEHEQVSYFVGARREIHFLSSDQKTWEGCKSFCEANKTHQLASMKSESERKESQKVMTGFQVWVGGRRRNDGIWRWTDGEEMGDWDWVKTTDEKPFCASLGGNSEALSQGDCEKRLSCFCQARPKPIKENTTLNFNFDKSSLPHSFQVWHQSEDGQEQSSRFRLSWRIENPRLEVVLKEPGTFVATPGYEMKDLRNYFQANHVYKASLDFSDRVMEQMGNNSMTVNLDVDTREVEGWDEYVTIRPKFWLVEEKKSWKEAQAHCESEEGHLASFETEEELEMVENKAQVSWDKSIAVWLGGREDKDGVWKWTNGSEIEPMWTGWMKTYGDAPFCFAMYNIRKQRRSCDHKRQFICQSLKYLRGKESLTLEYKTDEMFFSFLPVSYHYEAGARDLVNSWHDMRMTGFNLSWHISEKNGTSRPPKKSPSPQKWKPVQFIPGFRDANLNNLVRMVSLAKEVQRQNITWDQVKIRLVKEKYEKGQDHKDENSYNIFKNIDRCVNGQYALQTRTKYINNINLGVSIPPDWTFDSGETTDDDIKMGFQLYSSIVSCPGQAEELYNFLARLIEQENGATILRAIVNTLVANQMTEEDSKQGLLSFYDKLHQIFDLQFGKILLALSSSTQLKTMKNQSVPYFDSIESDIRDCEEKEDCTGAMKLINELDPEVALLSTVPPHLVDSKGNSFRSALIPFCAFDGNMSTLGQDIDGLDFPACNKFKPDIVDGRLCYTLDLEKAHFEDKAKTAHGRGTGLWILVDPGSYFLLGQPESQEEEPGNIISTKITIPKYYVYYRINNLVNYVDHRAGVYMIGSIKKMAGTDAFLALPDNTKGCQKENEMDCQKRTFLNELYDQCGCVPWAFSPALPSQVDQNFCGPNASSCQENVAAKDFGCKVSCTGLYTEISYRREKKDEAKIMGLIEAYRRYMERFGKDIVFNNSADDSEQRRDIDLQFIQINLEPPTYDKIEQDVKMTFSSVVMDVSGTMGGFVGFSILSGVEMVYFLLRFFFAAILKNKGNQ